ncbi:hypothetical protein [Streptomyces rubiginosohelvolus]
MLSEVLALAEDGYLRAAAYDNGYVLSSGTRNVAGLPAERVLLLDAILGGEGELRLRREAGPPASFRGGRISLSQIQKGVRQAARERGYLTRPYYVLFCGVVGVLAGVLLLLSGRGEPSMAVVLCTGGALLGTWSLARPHLGKAGSAEQHRVRALQDILRQLGRPTVPQDAETVLAPAYRLLPWAALLLDGQEFGRWCADNLLDVELPTWWTQEPDGRDPAVQFVSHHGMKGLLHTLLHHVGP